MSSTDLAAVTSLRITVNITMNCTDRAIEVGLQQLRASGIEWSAHPSEDEVQAEYDRLRRGLGERPIETLAELVSTRDPDLLAVMQILREMLPAAVFIDKNLHDLAVLRMANLSLEHGHCDSSPQAFTQLSMVVGPRFGHCDDGFRFGNLGMAADHGGVTPGGDPLGAGNGFLDLRRHFSLRVPIYRGSFARDRGQTTQAIEKSLA